MRVWRAAVAVVMGASLLIVQFAIWFDARHAALAAAQQGDLVAREDAATNPGGWQVLARPRPPATTAGWTPA